MSALRALALSCGLDEAIKWRKPCFIRKGANVAILQPFSADCRLLFFKGVMLPYPDGLLSSQGENTQSAHALRITSMAEVAAKSAAIRTLIAAAIVAEDAGLTPVYPQRHDLDLPPELVDSLDANAELAAAWADLMPGRQRSWVLHLTGAKQSSTRAARVKKAAARILLGNGSNER